MDSVVTAKPANFIVTITRRHGQQPEMQITRIKADDVDKYPMVTLRYQPDYSVVTTVLYTDILESDLKKDISGILEYTRFMLKETEYI